jgi:uncharacterized protein (TIGR03118 family)
MSRRCNPCRPVIRAVEHNARNDCCNWNSNECRRDCNWNSNECRSNCNCNTCYNRDCKPDCFEIKKKYTVVNLISNVPGRALVTDPNAVNSWGIIVTGSTVWVADNGTGLLTSYTKTGTPTAVVNVPGPGGVGVAAPDGIVLNPGPNFIITNGILSAPATILISTEDGLILGYNATVNAGSAIIVVDNSGLNTVYKGLAVTSTNLYACDFRHAKIDTFGPTFTPLTGFPFFDPTIPAGFAPFNIVLLNGLLYVLYAQQDSAMHDDVAAPGNGFINIFDTNGNFIRRLVSQGYLNSPWALVTAPNNCEFPMGSILVGNFGSGMIGVYDSKGKFLGMLEDHTCVDIFLQGLWGLANDPTSNKIFFASGPNAESNGLIGYLSP